MDGGCIFSVHEQETWQLNGKRHKMWIEEVCNASIVGTFPFLCNQSHTHLRLNSNKWFHVKCFPISNSSVMWSVFFQDLAYGIEFILCYLEWGKGLPNGIEDSLCVSKFWRRREISFCILVKLRKLSERWISCSSWLMFRGKFEGVHNGTAWTSLTELTKHGGNPSQF